MNLLEIKNLCGFDLVKIDHDPATDEWTFWYVRPGIPDDLHWKFSSSTIVLETPQFVKYIQRALETDFSKFMANQTGQDDLFIGAAE